MSQVLSAGDLSVMQSLSRCCLLASRAQKMACEHCQTSTCWPEVVAAWCPHGRTSSICVPDVPDTACFLISNEHNMANLFRADGSRAVSKVGLYKNAGYCMTPQYMEMMTQGAHKRTLHACLLGSCSSSTAPDLDNAELQI